MESSSSSSSSLSFASSDTPQSDDAVEDVDIFDDPFDDTICDRRLSRAARTLLRKHFLRAQHGYSPLDPLYDQETSKIDVWSLLEDMVGKTDASQCPLIPSHDVWRPDEEHTIGGVRIPSQLNLVYPTHALQQRRKASPKRLSSWFKCGYCGKVFSTQYYLDVHMHTRHHHHDGVIGEDGVICPATDWCRVVGVANCHEQALVDEPFYGRGSGGWGGDRKYVEHKWKKAAHSAPCELEAVRAECRSILSMCAVTLADDICGGLDCPTHHVWQKFSDSMSVFVPDDWNEAWVQEAEHHKGFVIVVCLVVFGIAYHLSGVNIFKRKRKTKLRTTPLRKGRGSGRNRLSRKGSKID